MSITYQQGKRIRKTGLMSLFADQLMYEKRVTTAIAKTISLKTRARVQGVTQYIDPLNIAKILTFGSSLGPALLGHFMGRDPRDIQYFTGRLKPIRERTKTAEKITKLPSTTSVDSEGMSIVLRKMYKLMAVQQEEEIRRRELAKNREEEIQLEDERRHKELLQALSGLGKPMTVTKVTKTESGLSGLWDTLTKMIGKVGDVVNGLIEKVGGWAAVSRLAAFLANPFTFITAIGGLASYFAATIAEDPNFQKMFSRENDPYGLLSAMSGDAGLASNILAESAKDQKEVKLRNDAFAVKRELLKNAPFLARNYDIGSRTYLKDNAGLSDEEISFLMDPTNTDLPREKILKRLQNGKTEKTEKLQKLKSTGDVSLNSTLSPVVNNTTNVTATTPTVPPPLSPTVENKGTKLDRTQDENLKGRVAYGTLKRMAPETQVNTTNVNQAPDKTIPLKRQVPAVRMQEDSFRDIIFSNTRPAN